MRFNLDPGAEPRSNKGAAWSGAMWLDPPSPNWENNELSRPQILQKSTQSPLFKTFTIDHPPRHYYCATVGVLYLMPDALRFKNSVLVTDRTTAAHPRLMKRMRRIQSFHLSRLLKSCYCWQYWLAGLPNLFAASRWVFGSHWPHWRYAAPVPWMPGWHQLKLNHQTYPLHYSYTWLVVDISQLT